MDVSGRGDAKWTDGKTEENVPGEMIERASGTTTRSSSRYVFLKISGLRA